jgi:hypothetical protein
MYPEEALGLDVQSARLMWEQVESLFENIRHLMRKSGRLFFHGVDSFMHGRSTGTIM